MIVHVLFSTVVQGALLPPVRKAVPHFGISTLSKPLKLSQFESVETCWKMPCLKKREGPARNRNVDLSHWVQPLRRKHRLQRIRLI